MPRVTFAGHPLHPILVTLPIGMLIFGSGMDFFAAAAPDSRRDYAAQAAHVAGLGSALVSAVAGVLDWTSLPRDRDLRRTGTIHGLLNLAVVGATTWNIAAHRRQENRALTCALSAFTIAGLFVSSWYGASLIYEGGVRVKGVDALADSPEIKPRSDRALQDAFGRLAKPLPPSAV